MDVDITIGWLYSVVDYNSLCMFLMIFVFLFDSFYFLISEVDIYSHAGLGVITGTCNQGHSLHMTILKTFFFFAFVTLPFLYLFYKSQLD